MRMSLLGAFGTRNPGRLSIQLGSTVGHPRRESESNCTHGCFPRVAVVSYLFLVVVVGTLPWVAFLGVTLPAHYDAGHWNLFWVGFDVGLVCRIGM
jgi:hypothetical protein